MIMLMIAPKLRKLLNRKLAKETKPALSSLLRKSRFLATQSAAPLARFELTLESRVLPPPNPLKLMETFPIDAEVSSCVVIWKLGKKLKMIVISTWTSNKYFCLNHKGKIKFYPLTLGCHTEISVSIQSFSIQSGGCLVNTIESNVRICETE